MPSWERNPEAYQPPERKELNRKVFQTDTSAQFPENPKRVVVIVGNGAAWRDFAAELAQTFEVVCPQVAKGSRSRINSSARAYSGGFFSLDYLVQSPG